MNSGVKITAAAIAISGAAAAHLINPSATRDEREQNRLLKILDIFVTCPFSVHH